MAVKVYKIDINEFYDWSPVPLVVRIRIALNKQGMKFEDDGKLSSITNENPTHQGSVLLGGTQVPQV